MNTHRKLLAWQACRELIREVYRVTKSFPRDELYGLTSQLRRAAVSSAANIAEGYSRVGPKETAHGLSIAIGSLAEVDTLFAVAEDLVYVTAKDLVTLDALLTRAAQLSHGLLRQVHRRIGR